MGRARSPQKLNIVLVLADSMRASNVSCYGYERRTTPHIDRLAERGIRFRSAFVQAPFTIASIASIFTGTYASTHRVEHYGQRLNCHLLSFPELLRENGYYTAAFVVNPHINEETRLTQGFDYFTDVRPWYKRPAFMAPFVAWAESGRVINRRVREQITRQPKEPFLFFVFYNDSHVPFSDLPKALLPLVGKRFHTPDFENESYTEEELGRIVDMYDRALRRTDRYIGKLWAMFKKAGLIDNTLFMISADHGEGLDRRPGRGGHGRLYDSGIHVPLIVLTPNRKGQGVVVDDLVSSLDLAPTFLDVAGIEVSPQFEGKSLLPYFRGDSRDPDSYVVSEYHDSCCIRTMRWKLIQHGVGISQALSETEPHSELYDLVADPHEGANVAAERPELVTDLRSLLNRALQEAKNKGRAPDQFERSNLVMKRLRGLGYLN